MKSNKLDKFTYDSEGYVNVWTNDATKGKSDEKRSSTIGQWLAPGAYGQQSVHTWPASKT